MQALERRHDKQVQALERTQAAREALENRHTAQMRALSRLAASPFQHGSACPSEARPSLARSCPKWHSVAGPAMSANFYVLAQSIVRPDIGTEFLAHGAKIEVTRHGFDV